jgi:hypothetical protein
MGASIMSETQYDRLESLIMSMRDDLAKVKTDVAVIKESVKDYPEKVELVTQHDKSIDLLKQDCAFIKTNCKSIQDQKDVKTVHPGALKLGIIVGGIVSLINVIFTLLITYLGK